MIITLSPIRMDASLTVARAGDTLTLNGVDIDVSTHIWNPEAEPHPWIIGQPVQVEGVWQVTLLLPHGRDAPQSVLWPAPITDPPDGPVALPTDSEE